MDSTIGQLLINASLPEKYRDYSRPLDKKGLKKLLTQVAQEDPEQYREISHRLSQIGYRAAQETGGYSFAPEHMRKSEVGRQIQRRMTAQLDRILADDSITDDARHQQIVLAAGREMSKQQEAIFQEALKARNPLAWQVQSGSRGNKMNLAGLLGSDLLYTDKSDNPIPIPVLHSYSEGLSAPEYWGGTYGARKGTIAAKFATRDAGFSAKQLNQLAHRLIVTAEDDTEPTKGIRGVPVPVDDEDSVGSLLAHDIGGYKRNTVLTSKILHDIKRAGHKRVLVRSAMVGGSIDGGVYARDIGIRETGRLPTRGEQVGLAAAQAVSEPISQAQLGAKHTGGVAGEGKIVSGFAYLNQLLQVPKTFKGGATHSTQDGIVRAIQDAPAGGKLILINGEEHYVPAALELTVKPGQRVEAGDVMTTGIPNPAIVVKHKGIGEGRRYFVDVFRKAMQESDSTVNRRNLELISRGLINHVRLTDEYDEYVPDDVIPYSSIEHRWKPRPKTEILPLTRAVGKYLESPVLHYSIGTVIRPSMLKDFEEFGVKELAVHQDPPPFEPEMIRAMATLQHDEDWMTRMYGSGLKGSLLKGVHRGAVSNTEGTSFVPSLAEGLSFGRNRGPVRQHARPTVKPAVPLPAFPLEDSVTAPVPPQPLDDSLTTLKAALFTKTDNVPGAANFTLPHTQMATTKPRVPLKAQSMSADLDVNNKRSVSHDLSQYQKFARSNEPGDCAAEETFEYRPR